jgi:hypothetical protein
VTPSIVRRKDLFYGLFLAAVFATVLILAKANFGTFPFANEDDVSFFIPAWNLAVFGDLRPIALNAPDGIYWVPHGFYLWIAVFLRLFGTTKGVAAAVCAISTAAAVVLLLLGLVRVASSRSFAALCAVILVSPATIFAADTIRMESLILLLYAAAVWLHTQSRHILALAVLALSLLVHPALSISVVLYGLSWLALAKFRRSSPASAPTRSIALSDVIVISLVLLAFAAEMRLIFGHLELFRAHMAFQAQRKASRTVADIMLHRRGFLLIAESLVFVTLGVGALDANVGRRFLRELAPIGLMALGLQAYAAIGYETPYAVYSYSIVPATMLCTAYGTVVLIQSQLRSNIAATDPINGAGERE